MEFENRYRASLIMAPHPRHSWVSPDVICACDPDVASRRRKIPCSLDDTNVIITERIAQGSSTQEISQDHNLLKQSYFEAIDAIKQSLI